MSKKLVIALFVLLLSAALIVGAVLINNIIPAGKPLNQSSQDIKENNYYMIGEYEGQLAVFESGRAVPFEVYGTFVNTLPEIDAKLIKEGIRVDTKEELYKRIEDFDS